MTRRKRSEKTGDAPPAVKIPHDPINEQVILAAVLVDDAVRRRLVSRINVDRFQVDENAVVWAAVKELEKQGLDFDPHTLKQLSGGKVNVDYVKRLISTHPTAPPNILHHASMLEWDYARLDAVRGPVTEFLRALQDPTSPPERVRSLSRQVAGAFDGHGDRRFLRDPVALVREQMVEIQQRRKVQACFPFGVDGLDYDENGDARLTPGAKSQLITVVTGIPGSGKSTLAARMILGLARQKRHVLVGAWEMGDGMTLELLACMALDWSRTKVMLGDLSDDETAQIEDMMDRISAYVRFMQMPFGRQRGQKWTNDSALDTIHAYIDDSGCEVAVFDLWKRCLRETRPDEEEQALIRQQSIAQETRTHIILVQQQRSKDIEMRKDKRPTREGIKGSGAWVEIADTIIGAHRPALWSNVDDDIFEAAILKQRYGKWPLAVEFDWDPEKGSLTSGRSIDYDAPGAVQSTDLDDWVGSKK